MRMALAVARLDFWNIDSGKHVDDLTPYEELLWKVYESIEPWGELRADMRAVTQTLQLIQANASRLIPEAARLEIIEHGLNYWKHRDKERKDITVEESARQAEEAFKAAKLR